MARAKRNKVLNGTYSVLICGLSELILFRDIIDKAKFIELIEEYTFVYHVYVYGYNFTNNSVEILLHDPKGNLSKYIKSVKGVYSQYHYNQKYNRNGTIYKDRFKSRLIGEQECKDLMINSLYKKLSLNDGNLINFNLDSKIVFDMVADYCKFDVSEALNKRFFRNNPDKLDAISILVFSLRSFCGYIHKNIAKILKGISETMSSTLSLKGVNLIMNGKFKELYFKLLMVVYSDERNFRGI